MYGIRFCVVGSFLELFHNSSPLLLIDRESCLKRSAFFTSLKANKVDPLDFAAIMLSLKRML